MHIVYLTHEYPPGEHGGIGTFTQTVARGLVAAGHRVSVAGPYPVPRKQIDDDHGVTVYRLPASTAMKSGFFVNRMRLRKCLQDIHTVHTIDVIEGPNLSLAQLPRSLAFPKVLRIHSTISTTKKPVWVRRWLIRRAFEAADAVCAVSRFCADSNRTNLRLGDRSITILFNPVDAAVFAPRDNASVNTGQILFVGTVCENKGVRELIQAMPEVLAAQPEATLVIVGRDWPDPVTGKSFTEAMRQEMPSDVLGHVQFAGPVPHGDIPELLASAQLCVFPSHLENMPVAWLEAMAMGKAIVASQTGPGPEVIEDGVSGVLCDPFDPASIARSIIKALSSDRLRTTMGAAARERFLSRFSLDAVLSQNIDFYQECIRNHGAVLTRPN